MRVAAVGTALKVLKEDGDWTQVEFHDPQWGPRIGWVQTKLIEISRPELRPMDISVREPAPPQPQPLPRNRSHKPRLRRASTRATAPGSTWVSASAPVAATAATCEQMVSAAASPSAAAITDRFMLGVGTTGYSRTLDGDLLTTGTLDARMRGIWRIGLRRERVHYALAIYKGIVREVYTVHRWEPALTTPYLTRTLDPELAKGRWEFVGEVAPPSVRDRYFGGSVQHYLQQGNQNPITYVGVP